MRDPVLVDVAVGDYGDERTLNLMYVARVEGEPRAMDDVAALAWHALDALPPLAFPHEARALARVRSGEAGSLNPPGSLRARVERTDPLKVAGRYVNPAFARGGGLKEPTFREFLRWRRERPKRDKRPVSVPRRAADDPKPGAPPTSGVRATWLGHSTVLLQLDGKTYLTDPVLSTRIGVFFKRATPPGLAFEDLPPVDALLLSHNHYDHLDAPTVKRLPRETPVFCPEGVARWFRRRGFTRVEERSWWGAADLAGHRVTFVPAQHFSGRTGFDRDKTLWGGWVVEGDRGSSAWYAGDSGWFDGFREIGAAFPGLDLAIVPIGAYTPRWFMAPVHVDPPEAGRAFLDAGARTMLPVHWGAFRLADEPVDEPPVVLEAWWRAQGLDPARLLKPPLGVPVDVPPAKPI